jgi:hypothetical protein
MFFVVKEDILERIKNYKNNSIWSNGFVDNKINSILCNEKETIAKFGALAWPLYYPFIFGLTFGKDIYYLLIGKNYENRIASRLV